LQAIVLLLKSDIEDVFGVLSRALFESWLVGVYAVLGGADAIARLVDHQDHHLKPILRVLGQESEDEGQRLSVYELAKLVSGLMRERGMPKPDFAERAYDVLYRWESYRNTHGGLGSIEGHIDRTGDKVRVRRKRPEEDVAVRHRFFVTIAIFISGAQIAAIETGLSHDPLDALADRVYSFDPTSRSSS